MWSRFIYALSQRGAAAVEQCGLDCAARVCDEELAR